MTHAYFDLTDQFQQEWSMSEQDRKIHELAERYHRETEAYDRTVCSGPVLHGAIIPIGYGELGLVNRNAGKVRKLIMAEADKIGIDRIGMARAIGRFSAPISDWPPNIIPAGAIVVDVADEGEDRTCRMKGFYDPAAGELHIQDVQYDK